MYRGQVRERGTRGVQMIAKPLVFFLMNFHDQLTLLVSDRFRNPWELFGFPPLQSADKNDSDWPT